MMQTLKGLDNAIGGRSKMVLRKRKERLSFYLGVKEAAQLKAYAESHELSISEIVRDKLKSLLKHLKA
ncbi:MAG: hypothetical protein OCD00_15755 [Colwellia sp.]